jgi:hypothetical protein
VEREDNESVAQRALHGLDGATDFVGAGHEDEDVAFAMCGDETLAFLGGNVPDRKVADGFVDVLDGDRKRAALGFEHEARLQVLDSANLEGGGHDEDEEIGAWVS